jgi:hypothetical protein
MKWDGCRRKQTGKKVRCVCIDKYTCTNSILQLRNAHGGAQKYINVEDNHRHLNYKGSAKKGRREIDLLLITEYGSGQNNYYFIYLIDLILLN